LEKKKTKYVNFKKKEVKMFFKCLIGIHSWDDFKCSDCEKTIQQQINKLVLTFKSETV